MSDRESNKLTGAQRDALLQQLTDKQREALFLWAENGFDDRAAVREVYKNTSSLYAWRHNDKLQLLRSDHLDTSVMTQSEAEAVITETARLKPTVLTKLNEHGEIVPDWKEIMAAPPGVVKFKFDGEGGMEVTVDTKVVLDAAKTILEQHKMNEPSTQVNIQVNNHAGMNEWWEDGHFEGE